METKQTRGGLIFGAILIAVGILLLFGQVANIFNQSDLWPFIVIAVGVAFFAGMLLGGKAAGPLAIPGSIITGIGLILLTQNYLGLWETWSYAWALIIVFVGVGIAIYGYWSEKPDSVRGGWELAKVGLILFLVFGILFEFLFSFIGISDRQMSIFWPIILIVIGALQFLWRAFRLITRPDEVRGEGRDLGGPIILTGVGLVAGLMVLDVMDFSQLLGLLSLWPLLLIFAGLQLIIGRRSPWIGAGLAVLLVASVLTVTLAGDRLGIKLGTPMFFVGNWNEPFNINERVRGNGEVVERAYEVEGFSKVSLSIPGKLEIVQSDHEALVVEAESNLLEYIEINTSGNHLEIDARRGYGLEPTRGLTFKLTVKDLEEVELSSAGETVMDGLQTDNLYLSSSGVGNFILDNLQAQRVEVQISGSGSASISGQADRVTVDISGAGSFTGGDLHVNDAEVNISGLGKASLWVDDSLDSNISGAGSITYYGDPRVYENTSGAGSVRRLGDK